MVEPGIREAASAICVRDGGTGEPEVLVGTAWIFPTNSSVNVAISQGGHAPPTGLSLEVQDPQGRWVTAQTSARCVIAHSLGRGFIALPYDAI